MLGWTVFPSCLCPAAARDQRRCNPSLAETCRRNAQNWPQQCLPMSAPSWCMKLSTHFRVTSMWRNVKRPVGAGTGRKRSTGRRIRRTSRTITSRSSEHCILQSPVAIEALFHYVNGAPCEHHLTSLLNDVWLHVCALCALFSVAYI